MSAVLVHAYEWDSGDTQRFVGLGVGRDTVVSYVHKRGRTLGTRESSFDTEDIVRVFDYSAAYPGVVGYGLNSGAVHIRELASNATGTAALTGTPTNTATTAAMAASTSPNSLLLKQRTSRKCNALSFNAAGNIVATGYERMRSAESLVLWDLSAQINAPVVQVNTHDTVLTAKFVPSDAHILLFGGSRMLREYDVRSNTIVNNVPTNMCAKITFNPHCDLMFATYGDSSSVALWDRRMLGESHHEPLLVIPRVFRESAKLEARCLRFSTENGNELAVLQDGAVIRRLQLSIMHSEKTGGVQHSSQLSSGLSQRREEDGGAAAGGGGGGSQKPPTFAQHEASVAPSFGHTSKLAANRNADCIMHQHVNDMEHWSLFVNRVFDVHTEADKVVSFDYAHNSAAERMEFVCLRQSGTVFCTPIAEPPTSIYIDPFNEFKMMMPPLKLLETAKDSHGRIMVSDLCSREVRFVIDSSEKYNRKMGKMQTPNSSNAANNANGDPASPATAVAAASGTTKATAATSSSEEESTSSSDEDEDEEDEDEEDEDINGNNTRKPSDTESTEGLSPRSRPPIMDRGHSKSKSKSFSGKRRSGGGSGGGVRSQQTSPVLSSAPQSPRIGAVDDGNSSDLEFEYNGEIELRTILSNDITSTMQRRAVAGYSLDAARNIELLSSSGDSSLSAGGYAPESSIASPPLSSGLLAAWKWVKQQQEIHSQPRNYLETPELDLRFVGVLNVWDGLTAEALKPRLVSNAKATAKTVDDAVKYAVRKSPGSVFVSADDDLTQYRELCLRLSGWNFGLNELEDRLVKLEAQGKFEKAAGWAAFHSNIERAVESLAKSRKKNLRLMSTAVAGYLVYKDVPTNNVWREQCRRLASELSAPYLRAVFAFIADGSWLDVLDDGSLPLAERIGIALRFLPPKEVGKYLSLLTSRAIANGDLEGIILTGFTPIVLDLLQAYLDRTGDIQTVCLLVSFGWPRYFDDPRLPIWFAEYRQLLNSWRYFSQRARLDIARRKLVPSRYQRSGPQIRDQAFLRCSNCKQLINTNALDNKDKGKRPVTREKRQQIWNKCPSCNHTLPPCSVCTLPLGPCLDDETESDRWPMFCLKCNHGYHSVHARQWFEKYDTCPVPSCTCLCARTTDL